MKKRNRKDFGEKTERHNPRPASDTVDINRQRPSSAASGDSEVQRGIKHILNQDVDVVPVHHSVPDAARICADCAVETVLVGHNVSHQLEKLQSTIKKLQHLQEVRSCPKCRSVVTAEKPCAPIPGSYVGPTLLADTIVGKLGDGLPLNRKTKMFKRENVVIPRSTQSDWVIASSMTVEPLYELLKREVFASAIIQTDDSELKVQDRNHKRKMRKGKITVYRGDRDHRYIVFDFSPDQSFKRNRLFLEDFKGIVQADAAGGFDQLFAEGSNKIEAGCNAHARRGFYDCLPIETKTCDEILNLYEKLYKIEREVRQAPDDVRHAARQTRSRPIFEELRKTFEQLDGSLNPTNPLMKAVAYALNHWQALTLFLDDPRVNIDNNASEREIKDFVLARKNFLFAGSNRGGKAAAIHMSLIASCKRIGVNPVEYLSDVFARINSMKMTDLHELLPDRWARAKRQNNIS